MTQSKLSANTQELKGGAKYRKLSDDIAQLLETAKSASARSVNAILTETYWQIGHRIVEFEQRGKRRAGYGEEIIQRLTADLTPRFGRGFGPRNLAQMRAFAIAWPKENILQTPSAKSPVTSEGALKPFQLPWSAYVRLLSVSNPNARRFYEVEALRGGWSVRQLDRQIGTQFYERTALSKNKAAMLRQSKKRIKSDTVSPEEAIKDPFVLEFLNLKDEYSESDFESALIEHLTDFLLELGDDFAFIGRQRRLRLDDTWFRIDLIFFHRRLRCLVIIDLKVGKFSHADAGQMHLYLNYALDHWVKPDENPPVGLILCAEKGSAEAHYALSNLPNKILASEYRTILPNEDLLAAELRRTEHKLERPSSIRNDSV